mgnify:CR=1 FL=1
MARSAGGRVVEQGTEQALTAAEQLQERIDLRKMACSPVEAIDEEDIQQTAEQLRAAADLLEAGSEAMYY